MSWIPHDETELAELRKEGFTEQQIARLYQLRREYAQDERDQLPLDRHRLEFARFLVKTGRLTEQMDSCHMAVKVETMDEEAGTLLLLQRAHLVAQDALLESASPTDRAVAAEITRELEGLPLALDLAGAYIEETGCGLAGYQHLYQVRRSELLQARGSFTDEYRFSVAITSSLSFEKVEQRNLAAADLFCFCAYLSSPDPIPEELLTKGVRELGETLAPVAADPFLLNQAIETLCAYALVSRDREAQTMTVHWLVQAVLRESLSVEFQQQWMQCAVQAVNTAFLSNLQFQSWPNCERLLPHVLICAAWIEHIPEMSLTAARLLNQAGVCLLGRSRYAEAEPLLKRAFRISEQQLGAQHLDTASSLNNLAYLFHAQGKYSEAEPLYLRALSIFEQTLSPEHPHTRIVRNNHAALLKAMKHQ